MKLIKQKLIYQKNQQEYKGFMEMGKKKRLKKLKENYQEPIIDIIIPVHGRFDLLKSCLESIPRAIGHDRYKIYIFDNASPDKEEADEFYRSVFSGKNISIIKSEQNVGFPRACNLAAKRGRSEFIFLLNSDVILYPEAIDYALDEFEDEKVGVVGMKLIFPPEIQDDPIRPAGTIQHIGLSTNIRGDFVHTFIGWSQEHPKV